MAVLRLLLTVWLVAAYTDHAERNAEHPARCSKGWWINDVMRYGDTPRFVHVAVRAWSNGVIAKARRRGKCR